MTPKPRCAVCGSSLDAVFHLKGSVFCKKCLRIARDREKTMEAARGEK